MTNLTKLPTWLKKNRVHVVVETPRGAHAKLKYDAKLGTFMLSKSLLLGLTYPYDWGFIPSTKGEDGDPLDAMVIHDVATSPGLVLCCKVIGVLETLQKERGKTLRNDRVIAVPTGSRREKEIDHVKQLPREVREELEKFFIATDELEDKSLKFLGWRGPKQAIELIKHQSRT